MFWYLTCFLCGLPPVHPGGSIGKAVKAVLSSTVCLPEGIILFEPVGPAMRAIEAITVALED